MVRGVPVGDVGFMKELELEDEFVEALGIGGTVGERDLRSLVSHRLRPQSPMVWWALGVLVALCRRTVGSLAPVACLKSHANARLWGW
eukprot:6381238-Prymnesium_polylepis.1